ncbi:hypothetical protein CCP3SC15_660006 [Gammaproteobacteria bacterium]
MPPDKAIDHNESVARVTRQSTIQVALATYSVPSRLIGRFYQVPYSSLFSLGSILLTH